MGQGTLLFVDEIHRFNRAQQDSFLPVMEDGTVTLIGATTENPSFELNAALLSRARVLVFRALDEAAIEKLLARAESLMARSLPLDEEARAALVRMADGDGRAALDARRRSLARRAARREFRHRGARRNRAAPRADLRQGAGGPLQSDLGPAQKRARLRSRRRALLSRAHVRRRRRSAVHRAARGAHGERGHRPRRSAGACRRQRRQGRVRFSRHAGRRTGDRPGGRLCRDGAQIQRDLCGFQGGQPARQGARLADAAEGHPQRADQADAR